MVFIDLELLNLAGCEIVVAWNPRLLEVRPDARRVLDLLVKQLAWSPRA